MIDVEALLDRCEGILVEKGPKAMKDYAEAEILRGALEELVKLGILSSLPAIDFNDPASWRTGGPVAVAAAPTLPAPASPIEERLPRAVLDRLPAPPAGNGATLTVTVRQNAVPEMRPSTATADLVAGLRDGRE